MKLLLIFLLSLLSLTAITPERAVILYNKNSPESVMIAEHYQVKRGIPKANMIAITCKPLASIGQADFQTKVIRPLSAELSKRGLWTVDETGMMRSKKFDVIVTIYGVPYKVGGTKIPATVDAQGNPVKARRRKYSEQDAASFDSELTLIGKGDYNKVALVKNPFFKSPLPYTKSPFPGMVMVGRIDGPSVATCIRMINDAIEVEKTGLYGKCYLDQAKKGKGYVKGDNWIKDIYDRNLKLGIPSVMDQNKDVFVTNYPLLDTAFYFGWYKKNIAGGFKNPALSLKKGSVAAHIHSFSAQNIRTVENFWSGPLLAKGAAVTLGNILEPGLRYTTHFDLFYEKLAGGSTVVESAWYATPGLSWHTLVLGDPLYRPFKNRKPSSKLDQDYEFLRANAPLDNAENRKIIGAKAQADKSALFHEAVGLSQMNSVDCLSSFNQAFDSAASPDIMLANALHQIRYHREQGDKEKVLASIQTYRELFQGTPQELPLAALKNIIDPPPPPPVQPTAK